MQVVPSSITVPWREIDLSEMDADARGQRLERSQDEDRLAGFDVAAPPLLRFALVKTAPARHRIVFTHHHLLLDGWSMPLLVKELFACYAGEDLPPITPYRDYADWMATQLGK